MKAITVQGGNRLTGEVQIHGGKNAALPILAATVAVGSPCVLHNVPNIQDVETAMEILRHLGCRVQRQGGTLTVDPSCRTKAAVPKELTGKMRSSVLFLGALLAAGDDTRLYPPGGCVLGKRPIDLHLSGLQQLGVTVETEEESITCFPARLQGGTVILRYPSVGATENLLLAAMGTQETVTILGAAREPEIVDLAQFLQACGAQVCGAGSSVIHARGGQLHGAQYTVMPDRMETATYLAAVAAAGGKIALRGAKTADLAAVVTAYQRAGCYIQDYSDALVVTAGRLEGIGHVCTGPYPGFATDAQPTLVAGLLRSRGTTVVEESVFASRFRYVPALQAMGADIALAGQMARVHGVPRLHGAVMQATDLRGGAAMVAAALGAEGTSKVIDVEHILRGYEDFSPMLKGLGAVIEMREEA